jgi:hypothetical protein
LDFRVGDGPLNETCADKPENAVVAVVIGRWVPSPSPGHEDANARPTAVVVAPNYIETVQHWGDLSIGPDGPGGGQPRTVQIEIDGHTETFKDSRINKTKDSQFGTMV